MSASDGDLPPDFVITEAGQFIIGAHRYLTAAHFLRFSDEALDYGKLLQTPILHLLAHGIELLLKFPLIRAGQSQAEIRKLFGHDLASLWSTDANSRLRDLCGAASINAWSAAKAAGLVMDERQLPPPVLLAEYVDVLSHLHDKGSGFALRYTISGPTPAPASAFLIDVFGEVARDIMVDPSILD
jgi:hypothetical protein